MAAATAVFQSLDPGDHVIVPRVMYWALRAWLVGFATRWGSRSRPLRTAARRHCGGGAAGSDQAHMAGNAGEPHLDGNRYRGGGSDRAAGRAKLVVDSTVATPVLTRPLSLGADIVMHSASKYLNGHSDIVGGTLTTAAKDEFWARIKTVQVQGGGIPGPFEAWLLQRGLRTLFAPRALAMRIGRDSGPTAGAAPGCERSALSWASQFPQP